MPSFFVFFLFSIRLLFNLVDCADTDKLVFTTFLDPYSHTFVFPAAESSSWSFKESVPRYSQLVNLG